jgi:hypothetical protein
MWQRQPSHPTMSVPTICSPLVATRSASGSAIEQCLSLGEPTGMPGGTGGKPPNLNDGGNVGRRGGSNRNHSVILGELPNERY